MVLGEKKPKPKKHLIRILSKLLVTPPE